FVCVDNVRTSSRLSDYNFAFSQAVDTSGVTDPAPQSVYQSIVYGSYFGDQKLGYQIPLADGKYTVRLHFVERDYNSTGRKFDIQIQGATVKSSYDIFDDAKAQYKATALSFPTTVSGGTGLS